MFADAKNEDKSGRPHELVKLSTFLEESEVVVRAKCQEITIAGYRHEWYFKKNIFRCLRSSKWFLPNFVGIGLSKIFREVSGRIVWGSISFLVRDWYGPKSGIFFCPKLYARKRICLKPSAPKTLFPEVSNILIVFFGYNSIRAKVFG